MAPLSGKIPHEPMIRNVPVEVECYAGQRSEEQPIRFSIFNMHFTIHEIVDRWYQNDVRPEFPPARYFKVRTQDGKMFMLKHQTDEDRWFLRIKGETMQV